MAGLEIMTPGATSHKIPISVQGHYLLRRAPQEKGLLVGFHGYGENAEVHLDALSQIPGSEAWALCAVQGPSVFYRQSTGEVVASWMTKFDREQVILDNVGFITRLLEKLCSEIGAHLPLVFAGFSQGVAMAYRAAAFTGFESQGLIALAGDVPPDLEEPQIRQLPPVLLGRGLADKWYNAAKMEGDLERLHAGGIAVTESVFDGGHEWHAAFLDSCSAFLSHLSPSIV